tara:strand:+ start:375 stop:1115 length:741 start_codon:yes stop_codon:yes gene_type:complete
MDDSLELNPLHPYQQNINTNQINNKEDIDISIKVLPFTFYEEQSPKLNYNNNGNKIIVPKYILYEISKYENIVFPCVFKYKNTYFGVLEFKECIDQVYIPNHLFYGLNLTENETIDFKILNKPLEKATYIKIKPLNEEFYLIQDQKKYLETHLKNLYTTISEDTTINLIYGTQTLPLKIVECKPTNHVSIDEIEELSIDIEPLVKPKEKPKIKFKMSTRLQGKKKEEFVPFSGTGRKLGGSSKNDS